MTGQLVVSAKPNYLNNENRILCETPIGGSLGEIADALCITPEARACLIVQVNGVVVPSNMWDHVWPKEGVLVEIYPAYRGGSRGKAVMGIVAMLALSAVTFGVGGFLSGTIIGGSFVSASTIAMVQGGMMLVGALAISALFAPPDQSMEDPTVAGEYYSLASVANRARPDGAMMRIYGKLKVFPDVIALPYITSDNGREYLSTIYGYGYGNVAREDTYVGNVRVEEMEPPHAWAIHRTFSAGDALHIYPEDVHQEVMDLTLMNDRPDPHGVWIPPEDNQWRIFKTEKNCDRVGLHFMFPEGLFMVDTKIDEGMRKAEIAVWIYFREVGTTTWLNFRSRLLPGNMVFDYPTNTNHTQIVEWRNDAVYGDRLWIRMKTITPFNLSINADMPSRAQYEFKVGRNDYPGGDPTLETQQDHTKTVIRALQTITKEPPLKPAVPIAMTERRFMASNQLSGNVDNISSICTAYIPYMENGQWMRPVYSGGANGTWSHPSTSNPAWIYLDILMGDANKKPLIDDDIDLDAFVKWAAYCDTPSPDDPSKPYLACNFVHTSYETVDQMLQKVAASGNAARHIRDGRHSIIWDADAPHATQIFTQRNSSGFQFVKNFIEIPHGIKMKFDNEENDYKEEVVIAYSPGYDETNSSVFEEMAAFGSTELNQSKRMGLRYLAMGRLRFSEFSFTTDIENLASERGDRVKVSFESVVEGGVVGRIVSLKKDAHGDVTHVTLDQKHDGIAAQAAGVPLGLMIRSLDRASASTRQPNVFTAHVSAFPSEYEVELDPPVVTTNLDVSVGDITVFGEIEEIIDDYIIVSVIPGADLIADILCTPYSPEIQYISNGGLIPESDGTVITVQPASVTLAIGEQSPSFTVDFTPSEATVQWQWRNGAGKEFADIAVGSTGKTYHMTQDILVEEHDGDEFRAKVSHTGHTVVYSHIALLTVTT